MWTDNYQHFQLSLLELSSFNSQVNNSTQVKINSSYYASPGNALLTYLWNLLKSLIFATNTGRSLLELSLGDLPGCCQTCGYSCSLWTPSYQNWLHEDDLEIMELWSQSKSGTKDTFHVLCPCVDNSESYFTEHGSWPAWLVKASNDWRNLMVCCHPPQNQSLLLTAEACTDQGCIGHGKEGNSFTGSLMAWVT